MQGGHAKSIRLLNGSHRECTASADRHANRCPQAQPSSTVRTDPADRRRLRRHCRSMTPPAPPARPSRHPLRALPPVQPDPDRQPRAARQPGPTGQPGLAGQFRADWRRWRSGRRPPAGLPARATLHAAVTVVLAVLPAASAGAGGLTTGPLRLASAAVATPVLAPSRPAPGGAWRWPLPGRPEVTRAFDPPDTPYGPGHRGVDLAAAPGAPVLAAGSGVVGWAGILAGRGVVSVRHAGGLRTTYEPLTPTVRAGQAVATGARLGLLARGHAGCPRAACLHWGLLRGAVYLDPLRLLGGGPIRLLPLTRAAPARADAGEATGGAAPAQAASADRRSPHRALLSPTRAATTVGLTLICAVLLSTRRPP